MKGNNVLILSLLLASPLTIGCGSREAADTSPLPAQDTQAKVDEATKKIEASEMTPEQKQASAEYLRRGAANAEQMKNSAGSTPSGSPN